jgi:hypothetical protein
MDSNRNVNFSAREVFLSGDLVRGHPVIFDQESEIFGLGRYNTLYVGAPFISHLLFDWLGSLPVLGNLGIYR